MSIAGNLKTMEFAELLQWLARGRKTGTLVIDNGKVEKQIFFRDGVIISSASSDPKEHLGHFLVSHGYITEAELAQSMELQEQSKTLLGKILTTIGVISEDDLDRMLRLKAEESLYDIFSWTEGEFHLIDGQLPERPMVPIALDVTALVLRGSQRHDEWNRIRLKIPSPQAVPVQVGEFEVDGADERARRVLQMVDDDRTVEEIALQAHTTEFFVCRTLFEQLARGHLKVVRPRPGARHVANGDDPAADVEALLGAAEKHIGGTKLETALRYLQAARSLGPDNRPVQDRVADLERKIRDRIEQGGIVLKAVPRLRRALEELTSLGISPQEGFLLSRINGSYDIETILKISPMPRLEAQAAFWKLLQAGHIELIPRASR